MPHKYECSLTHDVHQKSVCAHSGYDDYTHKYIMNTH